jgi:hypothetical protein
MQFDLLSVSWKQGDQIGRLSPKTLGSFLIIAEVAQTFWATFSPAKVKLCIYVDKKWLGLHLGDFFTNSSGHSAWKT